MSLGVCTDVITWDVHDRVFNFLLSEKLTDMVHLSWGLLGAAFGTVMKEAEDLSIKRIILAFAVTAIQGVVLFVVVCPVALVYVFGLGISAGASLWRLIKHDFGDDGGANKKPALQVLYSLAVAQGILFGYKMIHALAAKGGLVKFVYNQFDKRVPEKLVEEYLEETVAGCEKDPSFATGRNLVTYGVDLMVEAKSSEGFIAGIKVLGAAIDYLQSGRKVLAKYLLTRSDDSSSSIIQRLLETVGPRSPYSREIKEHVVRILDITGPCIRLEQFPRAIEYLCSVVDTSEDSKRWRCIDDDDDEYHVWRADEDYEREDLLQNYEKNYIYYYGDRIGSRDLGSTLLKKLIQCLPCKRKEEKIKREENITRGLDRLLTRATNIIYQLLAREDNIWILRTCVSNAVLHKIAMLPLKLHTDNNHDPFRLSESENPKLPFLEKKKMPELQMLEQCWVLTEGLLIALQPAATPVGEGRQRRRNEENQEIEEVEEDGNTMLIVRQNIESTIKSIFDCLGCTAIKKRQAIQILLHLSLDMSLIKDSESNKRRLSWILLLILCSTNDDSEYWMVPSLTSPNNNRRDFNGIRRLAGEKLSEMLREKHELPSDESARELQSVHLALGDLKSAFDADSEDISIRTYAIIIMGGLLWADYTNYSEVEEFLLDAFPKVVKETLFLSDSKTEVVKETLFLSDSKTEVTGVKKGRLQKALVSFCRNIYYDGKRGKNAELRSKFKAFASKTCDEQGKSFQDFKGLLRQPNK